MENFIITAAIIIAGLSLFVFTIIFVWAVVKKIQGNFRPLKKFPTTIYFLFSLAMSIVVGSIVGCLVNNPTVGRVAFILCAGVSIWLLKIKKVKGK